MTNKLRLRKCRSQLEWFMTGSRKVRVAKKIADGYNRRHEAFRLMMRAIYVPMQTASTIRVIKGDAYRSKLPMKQRRLLFDSLLKHKRAGYRGLIVTVKKETHWQSFIVAESKFDQFQLDNDVIKYKDATGEHWLDDRARSMIVV
ncbi:hypothetical protein D3C87_1146830 [compost metagenome]